MPIFLKGGKSVLYVHVPKTGGTAIEDFFLRNEFTAEFLDTGGLGSWNRYRKCAPQHMDASQILSILRPARFDYIFMTVRHPVKRLLSEYRMHVRHAAEKRPLNVWFDEMAAKYQHDPYCHENHFRPQSEFWFPACEVFRQDDGFGERLVQRVEEKLGLVFQHRQVSDVSAKDAIPIKTAQLESIRTRTRQMYAMDFVRFGY